MSCRSVNSQEKLNRVDLAVASQEEPTALNSLKSLISCPQNTTSATVLASYHPHFFSSPYNHLSKAAEEELWRKETARNKERNSLVVPDQSELYLMVVMTTHSNVAIDWHL